MATSKDDKKYKYFLFSQEYVNERNKTLASSGKQFICGTVTTGPTVKKYVYMSDKPSIGPMYPDAIVVAQGILDKMTYKAPSTEIKRR